MTKISHHPLRELSQKTIYIFDFDGVLTDSVDIKTQAFAELYREYGYSVVDKVVEHHQSNGGMSRFEKFVHYHKEFLGIILDDDTLKDLSSRFSNLVVNKVVLSDEIAGATRFLDQCKRNNIVCAINSATPDNELKKIVRLRGWKKFFQFVYGSPASKVDNIESILKEANLDRKSAMFFGDAINDYKAAVLSQVDFVGINYSSKIVGDFTHYNNFAELMN